jgi:hypothetical protein
MELKDWLKYHDRSENKQQVPKAPVFFPNGKKHTKMKELACHIKNVIQEEVKLKDLKNL